MAVTVVLTPVLQKAEKCRFYHEIGGCYKGTIILNSVPIRSIPFKCIFICFEKAFMRGKNEREIPLVLYIRLEYSVVFCDCLFGLRFNLLQWVYRLFFDSVKPRSF